MTILLDYQFLMEEVDIIPEGTVSCKFWGLGSDGTVGANKNTIKIIGDNTDLNIQAYFEYDGRKSGGVTKSHLRFGKKEIRSTYLVNKADFIACHNQSYLGIYDIIDDAKEGANVLIACTWSEDELENKLTDEFKKKAAEKKINLYIINSVAIAEEIGLGSRTNTILQAAFFKITNIISIDDAAKYMKEAIVNSYGNKGEKIVNMNYAAVDKGIEMVKQVEVPSSWSDIEVVPQEADESLPEWIRNIGNPVNAMKGNEIPVSAFADSANGTVPQGTSKFEKRGIANNVPEWIDENCIQCNQCAYVCPHAVIRPFLLNEEEVANAPEGFKSIKGIGKGLKDYEFRIQTSVLDCTGCGSCAEVCPSKEKALVMKPLSENYDQVDNWEYAISLSKKENPLKVTTVKGSQFELPLLEFNGACPGCGETPYAKLVTQLYGDRMYVATATGCAQVWSSSFPSFPYTTNEKGHGPASGSSLFENNAEYGMGIWLGVEQRREALFNRATELASITQDAKLKELANAWIESFNVTETSMEASEAFREYINNYKSEEAEKALVENILDNADNLTKKSVWIFGGDGWAYDIGYGGLDHVLASGANVNILVFDTEVYSNTGGQASKSTPTGAVAQFAAAGKRTKKKDLGMMAMSYEDVYVAQIGMGANQSQTLKAITEAESYDGPSLIIAYSPCIEQGLRCGMNDSQGEIKRAVDVGYWQLYRHNPELIKEGKNPFILDSKEPAGDFQEFLLGEVRYSSLAKSDPETSKELFEKTERDAKARYAKYKKLAKED